MNGHLCGTRGPFCLPQRGRSPARTPVLPARQGYHLGSHFPWRKQVLPGRTENLTGFGPSRTGSGHPWFKTMDLSVGIRPWTASPVDSLLAVQSPGPSAHYVSMSSEPSPGRNVNSSLRPFLPSPLCYFSRSRLGLHSLPQSSVHDAPADPVGHPVLHHATAPGPRQPGQDFPFENVFEALGRRRVNRCFARYFCSLTSAAPNA